MNRILGFMDVFLSLLIRENVGVGPCQLLKEISLGERDGILGYGEGKDSFFYMD